MSKKIQKIHKLTQVAKLYYIENKNQTEIAEILKVSRPLVSRMLNAAKDAGIVEIKINELLDKVSIIGNNLMDKFGVNLEAAVTDGDNDYVTDTRITQAVINTLSCKKERVVGIGWGNIIGDFSQTLTKEDKLEIRAVCPLQGNSNVSNKNYHSNELVRIVSEKAVARPVYVHAPAFVETLDELKNFQRTSSYKRLLSSWSSMSMAIVNIDNHPSSPDFGSAARYGPILSKNKAVGRILSHYFSEDGNIITSNSDYSIQIPVKDLVQCQKVMGICSANITESALRGALQSGILTHIIAPESMLSRVLDGN